MKNRRSISRILLFAVLLLCLSLSPIVSAQQKKPIIRTVQACCILGNWNLATHVGPGSRFNSAMAYDTSRGRLVLFGGRSASGSLKGDTWEWNGAAWTLRLGFTSGGPSPREYHTMAYDASRGRVVLFGGNDQIGLQGDTWEWDGTIWTRESNSGPGGREWHAMAYDSGRGKVILFGGDTGMGGYWHTDTWEWNGTVWTQKANSLAILGSWPVLADDSARGRVVLFSGGGFGDTWEWNGATWIKKNVAGPSARTGHSMAFSTACGKVTLFGGIGNSGGPYLGDTWQWDGTVWTQVATTGSARRYASMAYDSMNGQLILFGGETGTLSYSDETRTMYAGTPSPSPDFQLTATSQSGNSPTYQLTATSASLTPGVSFWWRVEEIDPVSGAVLPNTTMTNPPAWWANPTTNVFSGYYNNTSSVGVFYHGHKYRISRGIWSSCNPWAAASKTVFMCNNCRKPEMKDVPGIKIKPKIDMQ